MADIIETFVTFGVQYGHRPDDPKHPLGMLADGYAVVEAPDRETARRLIVAVFGTEWSFDYSAEEFLLGDTPVSRWHPDGELLRISWQTKEHLDELKALQTRLVFSDKPADPESYLPSVHTDGCRPDPKHPGYWICTEEGHVGSTPELDTADEPWEKPERFYDLLDPDEREI